MKFSEMNVYQKILFVFSVLSIVMAIFMIVMGGVFMATAEQIAAEVPEVTAQEMQILGLTFIFSAILSIITSIFGIRGARDISKIKPAFIFAVIGIVGAVLSAINSISANNFTSSTLMSVVSNGVIFYAAYKIYQEYKASQQA